MGKRKRIKDTYTDDVENQNPDKRRREHNHSERERRQHLKERHTELKQVIPSTMNTKASRSDILRQGEEYIETTKKRVKKNEEKIQHLDKQNACLKQLNTYLQKEKSPKAVAEISQFLLKTFGTQEMTEKTEYLEKILCMTVAEDSLETENSEKIFENARKETQDLEKQDDDLQKSIGFEETPQAAAEVCDIFPEMLETQEIFENVEDNIGLLEAEGIIETENFDTFKNFDSINLFHI